MATAREIAKQLRAEQDGTINEQAAAVVAYDQAAKQRADAEAAAVRARTTEQHRATEAVALLGLDKLIKLSTRSEEEIRTAAGDPVAPRRRSGRRGRSRGAAAAAAAPTDTAAADEVGDGSAALPAAARGAVQPVHGS
jgi:hypothetical protein